MRDTLLSETVETKKELISNMEKEFSKYDKAAIKWFSEAFDIDEEEVQDKYIPLTKEGEKVIKSIPLTKKELIAKDIEFIQKRLLIANFYQKGEGMQADYAIDIPEYRENLQDEMMKLIKKYLSCK